MTREVVEFLAASIQLRRQFPGGGDGGVLSGHGVQELSVYLFGLTAALLTLFPTQFEAHLQFLLLARHVLFGLVQPRLPFDALAVESDPLVAHLALGFLQLAHAPFILGDQRLVIALQAAQTLRLLLQFRQRRRWGIALVGAAAQAQSETKEIAARMLQTLETRRQPLIDNRRAARHRRGPRGRQTNLEAESADLQHIGVVQRFLVDGLAVEAGGMAAAAAIAYARTLAVALEDTMDGRHFRRNEGEIAARRPTEYDKIAVQRVMFARRIAVCDDQRRLTGLDRCLPFFAHDKPPNSGERENTAGGGQGRMANRRLCRGEEDGII